MRKNFFFPSPSDPFFPPTALNVLQCGRTAQVSDYRAMPPVPPWGPVPGRGPAGARHLLGAWGALPWSLTGVWQHPGMLGLGASAQQDQSCPSLLWPNPQGVRLAANSPGGEARHKGCERLLTAKRTSGAAALFN